MIRLSKLADYGIVLATFCARAPSVGAAVVSTYTARELAERAGIPLPTVGKILKALCRGGVLVSHRGAHGGYGLARPAETISVTEIIQALDGPIAMTECTAAIAGLCDIEQACPVRSNWQIINRTVAQALGKLTLSQMTIPMGPVKKRKDVNTTPTNVASPRHAHEKLAIVRELNTP